MALTILGLSGPGRAQTLLDPAAVPGLDAAGRALYAGWLLTNTPRAVAVGSNGKIGWYAGGPSLPAARTRALSLCAEHGGTGCQIYAENLDIVWPGREARSPPPPGPFVDTINYSFVPDERFLWHGPAAALGVVVWSHGKGGVDVDARGLQPPPFLRAFNNAGFDIVRFDRAPRVDLVLRARGWLEDELPALRRLGYRRVVAGGQSRGGWTSLQMLDTPGLVDAVIALSPAAHGHGGGLRSAGSGRRSARHRGGRSAGCHAGGGGAVLGRPVRLRPGQPGGVAAAAAGQGGGAAADRPASRAARPLRRHRPGVQQPVCLMPAALRGRPGATSHLPGG